MQEDPPADEGNRRRFTGPKVVPGDYLVILVVDGEKLSAPLKVLADPRVLDQGMTQGDFEEQFELCLKVQVLRKEANSFQAEIDTLLKNEERGTKKKIRRKKQELRQIREELVTADGIYPQPMLISQIGYLYSMISRADQKPGNHAYERYHELQDQLQELKTRTGTVQRQKVFCP